MIANPEFQNNLPSVLIGIVTHNRVEILPKAIESALAQKGCRVRVSVIDDCSTDATPELARQFPQVEWTRWEPNRGYMAARNQWMSDPDADYFVSLDDDAWFMRDDEIALAVEHMERHPGVAAVAFDILCPDRTEPVERRPPHPTGIFIGCGHVLKLSVIRKVGLYDSVPGSYGGEEKDLCLRLIDADYEIVEMPGVHVWHDKTNVARDFAAQHRSVVCNDLVMTARRLPAWLLPVVLPGKCWRHFTHAYQHHMLPACLEGFEIFIRSLPTALSTRKTVSAHAFWKFRLLSRGVLPITPFQETGPEKSAS